jgi:hypothetical protein
MGGKDSKANTHLNPLFVYSSIAFDRCVLPTGMDPIAAFHIASALVATVAPIAGGLNPYSSNLTAEEKVVRVVTCVKDQFKARCSAFPKSGSTIYHSSDDVVRFCYSLQTFLNPSLDNMFDYCSAPFNPRRTFDNFNVAQSPSGPFNVIETSSLADEVALPILLISSLRLLKRSREATLYTTSLVPADDAPPDQRLKSLVYWEPRTLLSCVPVGVCEWILK